LLFSEFLALKFQIKLESRGNLLILFVNIILKEILWDIYENNSSKFECDDLHCNWYITMLFLTRYMNTWIFRCHDGHELSCFFSIDVYQFFYIPMMHSQLHFIGQKETLLWLHLFLMAVTVFFRYRFLSIFKYVMCE